MTTTDIDGLTVKGGSVEVGIKLLALTKRADATGDISRSSLRAHRVRHRGFFDPGTSRQLAQVQCVRTREHGDNKFTRFDFADERFEHVIRWHLEGGSNLLAVSQVGYLPGIIAKHPVSNPNLLQSFDGWRHVYPGCIPA